MDAFFKAFRHHLALTSAGVDECANRFPARKEAYLEAYRRARDENLDVFVKAESSDDFAETLLVERVRASKEARKVMVEYCGDLPGSIDVLARHAAKLRSLLTYP